MKPKTNRAPGGHDDCQTPPYALDPLLPYLPKDKLIWEPAMGKGLLAMALRLKGYEVYATGDSYFEQTPPDNYIHVTNPPYSLLEEWITEAVAQGRPTALLVPVECIGAAGVQHQLFEVLQEQVEIILLSPRVDFYMPSLGFDGNGAQFPVMWLTWGLGIGKQVTTATLNKPDKYMYVNIATLVYDWHAGVDWVAQKERAKAQRREERRRLFNGERVECNQSRCQACNFVTGLVVTHPRLCKVSDNHDHVLVIEKQRGTVIDTLNQMEKAYDLGQFITYRRAGYIYFEEV